MSRGPRILVEPNAHHLLNLGDAAMLEVAVERLSELWPAATVEVLTDDPDRLARFCPAASPLPAEGRRLWFEDYVTSYTLHRLLPAGASARLLEGERRLRRRAPNATARLVRVRGALRRRPTAALDRFLDAARTADLVVSTGAGALTDHFAPLALTILDLLEEAHRRGAVTALLGHGIGPITDARLLARAARVLPQLDLITLREDVVGGPLLSRMGVGRERVVVTGDDAIEIGYRMHSPVELGSALGVNVRLASYARVETTAASIVGDVVRRAVERYAAEAVVVPISHHAAERDPEVAARLLGVPAEPNAPASPEEVTRRIGRCRLVVTGSYHAAVLALAQGVPSIGLTASPYYDAKFLGLQAQFDGLLPIVPLEGPGLADRLARAVDDTWPRADELRPRLLELAAAQVEAGRSAYRRLLEPVASRCLPYNLGDRGSPRWEERAEAAVELLARHAAGVTPDPVDGIRIADFGAGDERLRRVLAARLDLPHTCTGFDLHPRRPTVLQIDLSRELPPQPFDVVFCLGLLEYVDPLPPFVTRLARRYPMLVVSYALFDAPRPLGAGERRRRGWLHDFTRAELDATFGRAGLVRQDFRLVNDGRTGIWLLAASG